MKLHSLWLVGGLCLAPLALRAQDPSLFNVPGTRPPGAMPEAPSAPARPAAEAPASGAALTGTRAFKSPAAENAQQKYFETMKRAREIYLAELDQAVKAALAAGLLEEANALNEIMRRIESGGSPTTPGPAFRTPRANEARTRYERNLVATQKQYSVELQAALKTTMQAGELEEANAINLELKGIAAASVPAPAAPLSPAAATPVTTTFGSVGSGRVSGGLMMTRYARLPSQTGDRTRGYVPYTELGKPLGAPHVVKSLDDWRKEENENAVVSGFIRIDQPGSYQFRTITGWDRNELWVDGKKVCPFRDGENKVQTVELRAGVLPIVSVGYVNEAISIRTQWKPPGAADFTGIPNNLLSH